MDEVDYIQEAASAAQEAILADRRRIAEINARAVPPDELDCDVCGEPIPHARLKALPRTRLCVDCASDAERKRG
jgi:phage/conjugal plasmid C-4 type zinc finger TraR family protein